MDTASSAANASIGELLEMLAAPDPSIRDDIALRALVNRIGNGAPDDGFVELGDRLTATFESSAVQARTFAALVLAEVVERDRQVSGAGSAAVVRWRRGFLDWWLAEDDLRGFDAELGWLHAVAHGADALLAFGRSPHSDTTALVNLLEAAVDRIASTRALFDAAEKDRVAYAAFAILTRPELTATDSTGWLDRVAKRLGAGEPGPVPAWAANVARTLTSTYLLVDRGAHLPGETDIAVVPHKAAVCSAIATTYRVFWPPLR